MVLRSDRDKRLVGLKLGSGKEPVSRKVSFADVKILDKFVPEE